MNRGGQAGIALVTAMLVVALVATVAAFLSLGQTVWLRQTQNFRDLAQAEAVLQGGLNLAAVLIPQGTKVNPDTDDLSEPWAQPLPAFPVEGGSVSATISDAQARLNVNNLADANAVQKHAPAFRRLLQAQQLSPDLVDALIDWLDADANARPAGAEDPAYLALPVPYRAANRLMESVDELRLVKGFSAEAVQALRPFLTVLPTLTDVNINTASPEVISALFATPVAVSAVGQAINGREKTPFKNCTELEARLGGQKIDNCNVKTSYYEILAETQFGRLRRRSQALLFFDGKTASIKWQRQYLVKDIQLGS